MVQRFLVACFAFAAMSVQAAPVAFTSWQFSTDAVAISDAKPDAQSAIGTVDLVSASAASFGNSVATAGAIAGPGLLSSSADVSGLGTDTASAVGSAHFLGSFITGGDLLIGIDYASSSFSSGSGAGGSSLYATLVSGGKTLFSDYLGSSRTFLFSSAAGVAGTLELTLSSEANAGILAAGAGGYSTSALVNVTTPVPEPQTVLLLVVGLCAMTFYVRRRRF